jgi:Predicted permease
MMNVSNKLRDITLKNMFIFVTYIAGLILCLMYFDEIIGFIGTLLTVINPFLIGIVLAFIIHIPMKYLVKKLPIENMKKRKTVAAILSLLLIVFIIFFIIMVIVPQVIENIKLLIDDFPHVVKVLGEWFDYFTTRFHISPEILNKLEELQETLGTTVFDKISTWVPSIANSVTHFATGIFNVVMGFIMAVYMLFSKDKLIRQVKKLGKAFLSEKQYAFSVDLIHLVSSTMESFLAGQLTESVIIGVLCYIGCVILDIPYASIAALIIGFTNIIPYFGPIIGAFISCLLIVFVSPLKALIFLIFSTMLQQFESNLIYPHVVGNSVGLSALWVLFAVSVGGGLFGIIGMIFGLPVFSVIYELLRRWTNQRLERKKEKVN